MLAMVVLLPAASSGEKALTNLPYADPPHAEQHLDFYWPEKGAEQAILFIHGGSLKESGERRSSETYANVCSPFVAVGIGCATIDYRLHPSFKWPAMPDDVVSAIVRVRELIAARGAEPDRLFLMGHSSGCTLAATVGTNPKFLAKRNLDSRAIAGVIAMGCVLDNFDVTVREATAEKIQGLLDHFDDYASLYGTPENWMDGVPSFHVGEHQPPTLVMVARRERFFPAVLEQGARFVRLALELRRPADLVIVPGTHRSSIEDLGKSGDPAFQAILAFMRAPAEAGADSH